MKNFCEASVIKSNLTVNVKLTVNPIGTVKSKISINNHVWDLVICHHQMFEVNIPLTDPIKINIQIQREHPEALELELDIDNRKILPLYQHLTSTKTCYLDNNNPWNFSISNFYPWYHDITGQGWIA